MMIRVGGLSALAPAMAIMTLASTVSAAFADGVPITPGLWMIKTHNSMLGTEEVKQQCMRYDVFDPAALLGEAEGCAVSNQSIVDTTVDYDLICTDEQQRGSATGHFSFTVDGDQGSGTVDMDFDIGGETMSMQYVLAAARVGDC